VLKLAKKCFLQGTFLHDLEKDKTESMKNIAAVETKITELEKQKTELLYKQSLSLFKKLSVK
jgi:hypothetical protein